VAPGYGSAAASAARHPSHQLARDAGAGPPPRTGAPHAHALSPLTAPPRQAVAAPPTRERPGPGHPGPGLPPPGGVPPRPGGPGGPGGPGRGRPPGATPRRSAGQRALRWAVVAVALLVVLAGAAYGYVRYRWGQIHSVACTSCTPAGSGPFNVLIVGSDTRAGESAQGAQAFGSSSQVAGQRSDTIKILHVDPASGTARLLSIPRDTYVEMPQALQATFGRDEKINAAFNGGVNALVATIEDTFGISISHFVMVDFEGLTNAVNTVGGIYLDFPYPVRDDDNGNNNSGLDITRTGCQKLNGTETLALSRSRYYQYEENGSWHDDPTSDLGRIERQNIVIQALVARARSSDNPLTLNAFLGALVHDVTIDKAMTLGDIFSLATTYHALSPSSLASYTLPTVPETSAVAGDVEVVEQPQAQQVLTQFLGASPGTVTTPPVDAYGDPIHPPASTASPGGSSASPGGSPSSSSGPSRPGAGGSTSLANPVPPYDPTVCSP
jgi:LCP family protein required for cell wall assembly